MTMVLNPNSLVSFKVFNGYAPKEGPKSVSCVFDFTIDPTWIFDFAKLESEHTLEFIQSLFIDNSANPAPVTVNFQGTGQTIVASPFSQGYYPVEAIQQAKITVTCAQALTAQTTILFNNFPVPAAQWSSAQGIGANGAATPSLIGTQQFQASVSAGGNTTIIPASPGRAFFLTSIDITLRQTASLAVAGIDQLTLQDGAGGPIIARWQPYIQGAAPNGSGVIPIATHDGWQFTSKGLNRGLVANLATALATGNFDITAFGGYTNYLING